MSGIKATQDFSLSACWIPDSAQQPEQLDDEIARIRSQIRTLTTRRSIVISGLYATRSTQKILSHADRSGSALTTAARVEPPQPVEQISLRAAESVSHRQESSYRMGAGVTMFEVKDPDPYAVDRGRIFGIRMEIFSSGSYESPYYLLLKRPTRDSSTLQIHKHTIPAHIPLVALVNRYLPQPATTDATKNERPTRQQLPRLVRELRKELVCHRLRHASIALLQQKHGTTGEKQVNGIREITDESGDSRNVRVEWLDGKIGRVRINKEGLLSRCVIFDTKRRRRDLERTVMSGPKGIAYLHDCLALVEKIS